MRVLNKTKLAVVSALLLHTGAAYSAVHLNCQSSGNGSSSSWLYWPNDPTLAVDTVTLNAARRAAITVAAGRFNIIGDNARNVAIQNVSTGSFSSIFAAGNNNANNIWRGQNGTAFGSTLVYADGNCDTTPGQIGEFDIQIDTNPNIVVGVDYDPAQPQNYPLKLLAMHELGHGMGLDHPPSDLAIMNNSVMASGDFGQSNSVAYHASDKEGFRGSYGNGSAELNVAGSRYWVSSANAPGLNEYDLFTSPNAPFTPAPTNINRGSWYRLPFHIENQSANQSSDFQDVKVTFYASSNDFISPIDTYLGEALYTMYDGTEYQGSILFQLPNNLAGNGSPHWFGFILTKPYNSTPDLNTADDTVILRTPRNVF